MRPRASSTIVVEPDSVLKLFSGLAGCSVNGRRRGARDDRAAAAQPQASAPFAEDHPPASRRHTIGFGQRFDHSAARIQATDSAIARYPKELPICQQRRTRLTQFAVGGAHRQRLDLPMAVGLWRQCQQRAVAGHRNPGAVGRDDIAGVGTDAFAVIQHLHELLAVAHEDAVSGGHHRRPA